jgi:hypothetical protein
MNQAGKKQKEIQKRFNVSIYWTTHKEGSMTELYADTYNGRHSSKKQAILSGNGRVREAEVGFTTIHYAYHAEQAMGKAKNAMLDAIAEKLSR